MFDTPPLQAPAPTSGERRIAAARAQVQTMLMLEAQARTRLRNLERGEHGERQVLATLEALTGCGWTLLPDRQWPGTRANVDAILVGPGGVLVVDVKDWAEPRIESGLLWRGDADATGELDKDLAVTRLVEQAVSGLPGDLALVPREVLPVLVFAGRSEGPHEVQRVTVIGEAAVASWANRRGNRLQAEQVALVAAALAEDFPPHAHPAPPSAPDPEDWQQPSLIDVEDLCQSLLERAAAEPIEQWMTFLHPDQAKLVRRSFNGPARLRGSAGTGKTVVALHRAAHLAEHGAHRILVTSFVRTLPAVLQTLYERLAPGTSDRVEFIGLHSWAARLLRERGWSVRTDARQAESLFNRAWLARGARSCLASLPMPPQYWHEEVTAVIKGRALHDFAEYAALQRVGRKVALNLEQRAAVWEVRTAYQELLHDAGIADMADLITLALDALTIEPVSPAYDAVIADEVQDFSCTAIRLLHQLVGDKRDGLLLVGDGRQAVYPGGFSLAETGIGPLGGRATVLRVNYRNAQEICSAAEQFGAQQLADGIDETDEVPAADVLRAGGTAKQVVASGPAELESELLSEMDGLLKRGRRAGDCAVLTLTTSDSYRWLRVLKHANLPVLALEDYDGRPVDAIKVGTIKRAKGLEFGSVFVIGRQVWDRDAADGPERAELLRRELYVAATRARDDLWMGWLS